MINSFETLFEARERKYQQEKLFRGETVDLVARITTDGVMDTLSGYQISGIYQPTDELSGPFYALDAEIVDGKAVVHWDYTRDFGRTGYNVWGLLFKEGETAYPICWRLNFTHSPSYPLNAMPEPLPQTLDFSKYELLNAPWVEKEDLGEVLSDYLPLSGGTVTGKFAVKNFLSSVPTGTFLGENYKIVGLGAAAVGVGNDLSVADFGTAVGSRSVATNTGTTAVGTFAKATGSASTAIGKGATANGPTSIAVGNTAVTNAEYSTVVGASSTANGTKSIAIGFGTSTSADFQVRLGGSQHGYPTPQPQLWLFENMVLSGANATLLPERIPYLSAYETKEEATDAHQSLEDRLSDCATKDELEELQSSLTNYVETEKLDDYYTKEEADGKFLTAHQSLSAYATKEEVDLSAATFDFGEWTYSDLPTDTALSLFWAENENIWTVDIYNGPDSEGWMLPSDGVWSVDGENAVNLDIFLWNGSEMHKVSATRSATTTSYVLGTQTNKPLQPAGNYATEDWVDAQISAIPKPDMSEYLALSGGTVDWLHVDSIDFNVDNLLSVTPDSNGKMGGLFLGSDIRNDSGTPGYNAPIIIGNAQATYGMQGFSFPNIAIGNDSTVETNGIVIGGACGRKYEYGLGTGTVANPTVTPIFNPKREDIDLNDLVFVDENGDPVTSEMLLLDKILGYDSRGIQQTFSRHGTNNEWGYYTQRRVGPRIQTIWVSGGTFTQNALFFYQRYSNVGGNITLKFDPDPINSLDHSAAAGFSLAIGNDTMAGSWISSDVFNFWFNPGAIAIGHGSIAKDFGTISFGTGNLIEGGRSIGIGFNANTSAEYAIQLGTGTNSTPHSLQYEDTQIVAKTYDTSLSVWTNPKLNTALFPNALSAVTLESWTFTLDDDSTVTKNVLIG